MLKPAGVDMAQLQLLYIRPDRLTGYSQLEWRGFRINQAATGLLCLERLDQLIYSSIIVAIDP